MSITDGTNRRDQRKPIQSVERAINILNELTEPQGLVELTNILGLNKTTIYNLLSTLMKHQLVHQLADTKQYVLGYGLARLQVTQKYSAVTQMTRTFRNDLHKLMVETQDTAHLAVLVENKIVIIDTAVPDRSLSVNPRINEPLPPYCTSVGKAILASLPNDKWQKIINKEHFQQYTGNTITNIIDFTKEIERIRTQGFSVDDEEYEEGIRCVGVPFCIEEKEIIAAIAVTGPTLRLPDDKIIPLSKILIKCVNECRKKVKGYLK